MPRKVRVWDPFVRIFHWSVVGGFLANAIFTNPEKSLHHTIGLTVLGLVALRLVWGLIGPRHARFSDFPPNPAAAMDQMREMATGRRRIHLGHSPLGALMIYNLLLTLIAIGVTGYMQTTVAWFGVEWVEELHGAFVTWAEISVALHVLAVFTESRRLGVNLPRSMLTGYKSLPEASSGE
ncbi:cytochrome b/b6 domain-containing protein [Tabrizicola sp. J26]|uniref:cytochrome b/b6 domain-containing protein n=1 Tax=Alitabrizicola rongguiensis TaxID=2909234 RepID=UPI001F464B46|nr:cytochrome b/b6 domain-containing protein [Tabrizicola rongguiensis]MCF1710021.1 cytochrome b/b6 domain-containing protein [Tabrizicola rongguiensis]